MSQGNVLAYLALGAFPLLSILLFKRFSLEKAIVWTIFLGFLFLPVKTWFDFPLLPVLDKISIPVLVALGLAVLYSREKFYIFPKSILLRFFLFGFAFCSVFTGYFNQNRIRIGSTVLEGMDPFSGVGISAILINIFYILPFVVGYIFLSKQSSLVVLLKVIAISGTCYTLLILWEIRMSPQLHAGLYGYFPHQFLQQMRQDGFRSVAFIGHGLRTSMLLVAVLVGVLYFAKEKQKIFKINSWILVCYLVVVIVLNKSLAFLIYAVFAVAFSLFLSSKFQRVLILTVCFVVLSYPALRGSDYFPDEVLSDWATSYSEERAQSLIFRFDNEAVLLARAAEKSLFGWGEYGRNRVYDEFGNDISVTDGDWIIYLGTRGWFGYITMYGLLLFPVVQAIRLTRLGIDFSHEAIYLSCIVMIVCVNTLVNSGIYPWVWLMCGALAGNVDRINRGFSPNFR